MSNYQLERAYRLLEAGLCSTCAGPKVGKCTKWLCARCAEKNRKANSRWYAKNRTSSREKQHVHSAECWCLPRVEVRDGIKVWIHEGGLEHGS